MIYNKNGEVFEYEGKMYMIGQAKNILQIVKKEGKV